MLSLKHINQSGYQEQSWKNGKGKTWQIARDPDDPYRWRVSLAYVAESGEFSLFPGYERVLMPLSPPPMSLLHDGKVCVPLLPLTPYLFSGERQTMANVSGPVEDLNVFLSRERAKGSVHIARIRQGEEYHFPLRGQEHLLFLVEGKLRLEERNLERALTLMARETCHISRPGKREYLDLKTVGVASHSVVAWMVIHLR